MAVLRTFRCKTCSHKWSKLYKKDGFSDAKCPQCEASSERTHPSMPKSDFTASRAAETTFRMVERDYGYTDMKDNMREGDVAIKTPNPVAAVSAKMGGMFGQGLPAQVAGGQASAMDMARAAKAERTQQGLSDPFASFQNAAKGDRSIIDKTRMNPIARHKL